MLNSESFGEYNNLRRRVTLISSQLIQSKMYFRSAEMLSEIHALKLNLLSLSPEPFLVHYYLSS